ASALAPHVSTRDLGGPHRPLLHRGEWRRRPADGVRPRVSRLADLRRGPGHRPAGVQRDDRVRQPNGDGRGVGGRHPRRPRLARPHPSPAGPDLALARTRRRCARPDRVGRLGGPLAPLPAARDRPLPHLHGAAAERSRAPPPSRTTRRCARAGCRAPHGPAPARPGGGGRHRHRPRHDRLRFGPALGEPRRRDHRTTALRRGGRGPVARHRGDRLPRLDAHRHPFAAGDRRPPLPAAPRRGAPRCARGASGGGLHAVLHGRASPARRRAHRRRRRRLAQCRAPEPRHHAAGGIRRDRAGRGRRDSDDDGL
ncbi:MAG: Heme A synthase, cytochrome oxidase biogenesis protein Cox15-CtaA, partial [uncultured Acidimicrobiales bacterium]